MIVHYPIKPLEFSSESFNARVAEVKEIRDWLDLTQWDKNSYAMSYHSSGSAMVIWFERDKDAAFFMLRWL